MAIDEYHQRVEGSDDDQVCIGRSPDMTSATRSDDSVRTCPALGEVVQAVIDRFRRTRLCVAKSAATMEVGVMSGPEA